MHLSFHGGARTVTGSKHIISLKDGTNILLDCGMFQGMGAETDELNSSFGFDPATISFVLLSHAHIDHSGLIPKLVKEGFTGKIYCTAATAELTEILLHDSAEIQTYETAVAHNGNGTSADSNHDALYTHEDVVQSMHLFKIINYDQPFFPSENVEIVFTNNGHLLGSAAINISITEEGRTKRILYSGDVGRFRSVLLQPPQETPQADYIIIESTYGDKHHDVAFNNIEVLREWVQKTCIEKQGKLIIPAFSVGRTQEILYLLNQLELERRLPELNYFVDSPLSQKATTALKNYIPLYNDRLQEIMKIDDDPFLFNGLKFIENVEDSRRLREIDQPCVIISASGTADAGRVKGHIASCVSDSKNAILMSGYCGGRSVGGRLLNGDKELELFKEPLAVKAEIGAITGLSAHADSDDLLQFLNCQDPEKVSTIFLVHGEYNTQVGFKSKLENKNFRNVVIPVPHESISLDV
jgi:metallo-beta-lactamase family protein